MRVNGIDAEGRLRRRSQVALGEAAREEECRKCAGGTGQADRPDPPAEPLDVPVSPGGIVRSGGAKMSQSASPINAHSAISPNATHAHHSLSLRKSATQSAVTAATAKSRLKRPSD